MQNLFAAPLTIRLLVIFVVSAVVASLLNAAIYHFAWDRRLRSAWQPAAKDAPPRKWYDRLPIVGWWFLRRESSLHGTAHWVRPLFIEIFFPFGLAWLYWWEVELQGLFTEQAAAAMPGGVGLLNLTPLAGPLHWQFLAHAVLASLMLVATFIDFDERNIPDIVTVPGTLIGLLFATLVPLVLLPQITTPIVTPAASVALQRNGGAPALDNVGSQLYYEPVHLAAASPWPDLLNPRPQVYSLAIGIGCFWLWCFAYLPREWRAKFGITHALWYYFARLWCDWKRTEWLELRLLGKLKVPIPFSNMLVTTLGSLAIFAVWWWGGGAWVGLLSALVGLVGSGGTVWLIRIFAWAALRKEAMGFGDVLLMMMVGTFIGWQAGVLVFFLALFAALVFGVANLILKSDNEIPYGPFLCAATLFVIIRWDNIWFGAANLFAVPWLAPAVLLVCLVLCGAILAVWQAIKVRLWGDE